MLNKMSHYFLDRRYLTFRLKKMKDSSSPPCCKYGLTMLLMLGLSRRVADPDPDDEIIGIRINLFSWVGFGYGSKSQKNNY